MKLIAIWILISLICLGAVSCKKADEGLKPNVIIIFTDDQGYQDLGCFGSPNIKTPNLDQMANEGTRFTNFYVTASVCCPSRASILTGRYSVRNGIGGVLLPGAKGMRSSEITIAEFLKQAGYKTACFGKWHLGDQEQSLPTAQGFDEYYGLPYSNDMHLGAAQEFSPDAVFTNGYTLEKAKKDIAFNASHTRQEIEEQGLRNLVPLLDGTKIVEYPANQGTLTKRYFERTINFINKAGKEPFFVYLTPNMPHIPLFASTEFEGTSERGLYGDVVEEIDWNVGKLMSFLKENDLDKNTMVFFTSDNGPWLGYGDMAGSADPLRGGKFTNYEGGVRVPCVMRWPGIWEEGKTSDAIISTLDFLPTIAHYAGVEIPENLIDGKDISRHLENTNMDLSQEIIYYTKGTEIVGVRKGEWKYLPHSGARNITKDSEPELFNLKNDIEETRNVYDVYPEIVDTLSELIINYNQSVRN